MKGLPKDLPNLRLLAFCNVAKFNFFLKEVEM